LYEGYYQSNSQCFPCSNLCKTCISSTCGQNDFVEDAELVSGQCKGGFYEKNSSCLPCNQLCKECSDDTTYKKCAEKAAIYLGECKCTMGYYLKDNQCENCTTTGCSECKANAEMKNGDCVCKEGYYKEGNQCAKRTDPLCKTCDLTGGNCSACVDNSNSVNNFCVCSTGYYHEKSRCTRFPDLAASCAFPFDTPLTNLVCKSNSVKNSNNLDCKCKEGYFFWGYECKTCDIRVCTYCTLTKAALANGLCFCKSGLKYSSDDRGKCIACESLCTNCQHVGCLKCKANSGIVNSVCTCNYG
jgi:proprotein convertase subtilisin/kexin type 5